MEGQNKHFSHTHNLNLHKLPESTEITCSGCNSSGTAAVYACWTCNFFLHEQCFRAARSLHHPSHPSHPLTLLPFPTYPSNSFVCNSCNQVGTGFTYCCSNCEFDLHVQCAYNISIHSHLTPRTHILPQQETLPSFNPQKAYSPHQAVTYQETLARFAPLSNQAPVFIPQNPYFLHQDLTHQHIPNPSPSQQILPSYNPQYASVLPQVPTNLPVPSSSIPTYPSINETLPSLNALQNSQIPQPSHNPQQIPSNHIQNYQPVKEKVQNFDEETEVKESRDEETAVKESRDEEPESSTGNPVLDAQLQMQRLQLQMEMAHQCAQMIASMGQSISNLAG